MSDGFLGLPESGSDQINIQALALARKLKRIVEVKLNHRKAWSETNWTNTFRLLIKDVGLDKVTSVLDWYDGYCNNSPKYEAKSAKSFRNMFEALQGICERAQKSAKPAKMSKEGIETAARLRSECQWPAKADKTLDAAVENSIQAYIKFKSKLCSLKDSTKDRMLGFFLDYIAPEMIRDPEDFVFGWFYRVYQSVKGWKTWNGDLVNRQFSEDSERLDDFGTDLAIAWGDRSFWTKTMNLVKE